MAVQLYIGTSGWSYSAWGAFYPRGLPAHRRLEHAAAVFGTLEINRSFYSLLKPATYLDWYARTPSRFVFALKGGRFITHVKRLRDVEVPLANFFASGVLALEEKLGPIVWQLPPNFRFEPERIARFLELLPKSTYAASALGARHDLRLATEAYLEPKSDRPLRHAIEPRHPSFCDPAFAALMRRHGAAVVVSESPAWPRFEELSADFVYARLHGAAETYRSPYGWAELGAWAQRIRGFTHAQVAPDAPRICELRPKRPRAVYVYFDNDSSGHAPRDAQRLAQLLRSRVGEVHAPNCAGSLR